MRQGSAERNGFAAIGLLLGLVLATNCQSGYREASATVSQRAAKPALDSGVKVDTARKIDRVAYEIPLGGQGFITAKPGNSLIIIELSLTKAGEILLQAPGTYLRDSTNREFSPLAAAPSSIQYLQSFDNIVSGTSRIEVPDKTAITIGRANRRDPLDVKIEGPQGSKFFLVYEIAGDSRRLKLTIGKSEAIPVQLEP